MKAGNFFRTGIMVLYPALVFGLLVAARVPLRVFSLFVVVLGFTLFISVTAKKKRKMSAALR
jgi:hypothetical protein